MTEIIPNGTGAEVREDINDELAKLEAAIEDESNPVSVRTETTYQLLPNIFYTWGTMASLSLTLGVPMVGKANEYSLTFSSGATATTFSLTAANLKWINNIALTPAANKTYLVSILYTGTYYLASFGEF